MLAVLIDIPANVGYAAVFALIAVATMGVPVPGETALVGRRAPDRLPGHPPAASGALTDDEPDASC